MAGVRGHGFPDAHAQADRIAEHHPEPVADADPIAVADPVANARAGGCLPTEWPPG
jgi:hypothetical protein